MPLVLVSLPFPVLPVVASIVESLSISLRTVHIQSKTNPTFGRPLGTQIKEKGTRPTLLREKKLKKIGRVYYIQVATTPEGEPLMMGTFLVANHPAVILFDSGASHTFISKTFVEKYCIHCCHTRILGVKNPGANINTRCAGTKSHTYDA
jgi:hypothetical protein